MADSDGLNANGFLFIMGAMNYVWYHLTRDPKFWLKTVILPGVFVLVLLDFFTFTFKPPGIFNLWFFKTTLAAGVLWLVGYGIHLIIHPRKENKIRLDQAEYEKMREGEIRRIIEENPDFQTHCYTCSHFNQDIRACRLDIRNPRARDLRINERSRVCLYWEALDPDWLQ